MNNQIQAAAARAMQNTNVAEGTKRSETQEKVSEIKMLLSELTEARTEITKVIDPILKSIPQPEEPENIDKLNGPTRLYENLDSISSELKAEIEFLKFLLKRIEI